MSFPQLMCAYDPATGRELWRCDGLNELVYSSPVYADGLVVGMGGFSGSTIVGSVPMHAVQTVRLGASTMKGTIVTDEGCAMSATSST